MFNRGGGAGCAGCAIVHLKFDDFYKLSGEFFLNRIKGLMRLAHSDLQEWQETAHTNSYIPDTTSKCSKCYFQCQVGSSLLIKTLFETPS